MLRVCFLTVLLALGLRALDPSFEKLVQQTDKLESYSDRMMAAIQYLTSNETLRAAWDKHITEHQQLEAKAKHGLANFPCDATKTTVVPESVHALTPGDIKVVGAIGDSLSAGSGIEAFTPIGLVIPWRGRTFSAGGDRNLEKFLTLPNVLKKFNSELYGYATGAGSWMFPNAHLNLAVPGAVSSGMPTQAKRLVDRMKSDRKVDFENDWKVITLFIGGNDLCGSCKPQNEGKREPEQYVDHIKEALDYFHEQVPRAFVNVILMLQVDILADMKPGIVCQVMHLLECRCGAYPASEEAREELKQRTQQYINQLDDLVTSGRYDTREDFTVVSQPFFTETELPQKDGKADLSYFAVDCFHLSMSGQEAAALSLWNNMIEPVGKKKRSWHIGEEFECPTRTQPFFGTYKNSGLQKKQQFAARSHVQDNVNSPLDERFVEDTPFNPQESDAPGKNNTLGIALGSFAGCMLLVLAVGVIIVRRRRKPKPEYQQLLVE